MIGVQSSSLRRVEYARNSRLTTAFHTGGVDACHGLPYAACVAPPAHSLTVLPGLTSAAFRFQLFSFSSAPCLILGVPGTVLVWRGQPHNVHP